MVASIIKQKAADGFVNRLWPCLFFMVIDKRACVSLHASCAGNILRLGDNSEFWGVDNRPRENGHSVPLLLGVYSFLCVTSVVCEELGIDDTQWKLRLYDLLIYYNSLLEGDKNA